mmetsp:Transcript_111273/g.314075  ORF Transcript_111273/g.314075 Transcript_111273/m.314075 type:complete len:208 (-) Transcript_111273:335-958(-)
MLLWTTCDGLTRSKPVFATRTRRARRPRRASRPLRRLSKRSRSRVCGWHTMGCWHTSLLQGQRQQSYIPLAFRMWSLSGLHPLTFGPWQHSGIEVRHGCQKNWVTCLGSDLCTMLSECVWSSVQATRGGLMCAVNLHRLQRVGNCMMPWLSIWLRFWSWQVGAPRIQLMPSFWEKGRAPVHKEAACSRNLCQWWHGTGCWVQPTPQR